MKKIKITEDQLNRILKEEQEWSGSKPKEEGIVKVTIQLSDGEVESYILPAKDVNNVSNRVEEIPGTCRYILRLSLLQNILAAELR